MKVYANLDSDASVSFLKSYDANLVRIEMSSETKNKLPTLENGSIANWLNSHNIISSAALGFGIVCGVIE